MFTRRRSIPIAALLAALALAACGGASPSAKSSAEESLPPTPEEALDLLDRSEYELRLALGEPVSRALGAPQQPDASPNSVPGAQPPVATEAQPASPPPPPSPTPPEALKRPAKVESAGESAPSASATSTTDPCSNACRALASMERATVHLCTLAGSADARCEGARARVQIARARVHAQCPACSGD
jgi:outer membrane biosynthesis protein TonB